MNRTQNKELHDTLRALDVQLPRPSKHRAELRRALLHVQPRRQFFVTRLFDGFTEYNGGNIMKNIKFIAPAGMALAIIAVAGTVMFTSVARSPHAIAESITASSINSLDRMGSNELSALSLRFSSDPAAALQEAKDAKDLKTISRSDFEQLKKIAQTIATTSEVKRLPGGGYEASGSVEGDTGAGSAGGGTVTQPLPADVGQSNGGSSGGSNVTNGDAAPQNMSRDYIAETLAQSQDKAKKFVSYTNAAGNSVVIGFDGDNLPLFKSVFTKNLTESP